MKKLFTSLFFLCSLIAFLLGSCYAADKDSSSTLEPVSNTESASASEVSNESDESEDSMEIKDYPYVTGTFIQPWLFNDASVSKWENHFDYLLEAGIDTVIIQWTAETPHGEFKSVYYPSELAESNKGTGYDIKPYYLEHCLKAAEEKGIKVFVGLNLSDEWWSGAILEDDWRKNQSELGNGIAKEIYDLYKTEYPNALYGWYFAWEFYNGMEGYEDNAANFLNSYLDYLTELDSSMPLMLSPFVSSSASNAISAGQQWTKVFSMTNFRYGDIFCCQDSVGAGHISIEQLDDYYKEIKKACDTIPELSFWANNENFDQSDWISADLGRFVKQMEISDVYVENHVTFSYSHYYSPDINNDGFHDAYLKYYNTGKLVEYDIPAPDVVYNINGDNVEFEISSQSSEIGYYKVYLHRNGALIKEKLITSYTGSPATIILTDEIEGLASGGSNKYQIYITDINGNKSAVTAVEITK